MPVQRYPVIEFGNRSGESILFSPVYESVSVNGGKITANPVDFESKSDNAVRKVMLMVGLNHSDDRHRGHKTKFKKFVKFVIDRRSLDVGKTGGASYILQHGHWWNKGRLAREESVLVTIMPAKREKTSKVFQENIEHLVEAIVDDLYQDSVMAHFFWDGVEKQGDYNWRA